MTPEQIALAQRCVQASAWRWLPGMRASAGGFYRIVKVMPPGTTVAIPDDTDDDNYACEIDLAQALPDLNDAATRGCLLDLIRQHWHTDLAPCCIGTPLWKWCGIIHTALLDLMTDTEIELLVLTLCRARDNA
jgi:hypothetical protein